MLKQFQLASIFNFFVMQLTGHMVVLRAKRRNNISLRKTNLRNVFLIDQFSSGRGSEKFKLRKKKFIDKMGDKDLRCEPVL